MDVVISGSSGLIGTALAEGLRRAGHRPIRLVRRPATNSDEIEWDPVGGQLDAASLEGVDAVVNLAGAGIASRRWSDDYRRQLHQSRIDTTALLAGTLAGLTRPPAVLISGSAIGYYGNRGAERLEESSPPGDDFLARLCRDWEAATDPAAATGIRTVTIRTGIVQSTAGGALAKTLPLFRFGLGGRFGAGTQFQSWIHIDDVVEAIIFLLDATVRGPVNLTAPEPVTNREYTATLGRVLGRPTVLTVPAFAPKLVLGSDLAQSLLFDSMRVIPTALTDAGYAFRFATLEPALTDLVGKP